jgi:ATP-dependent Clp protease ATP-binding subunit ClpC
VDLMIAKVDDRMKDRDMGILLRPAAKTLLSERGYDPVLGARPLRRTIQREIEDSLSEKILFGELRPGQIVVVDAEGSGETATFTFTGEPKPDVLPDLPVDLTSEAVTTKSGAVGSSSGGPSITDGGGTASAMG